VRRGDKIVNIFSDIAKWFKRKPKLKVHREPEDDKSEKDFEKKLDAILDRYGKVGEAGLTREEREFLQYASKKYRDKHGM
jgi:hypothetical protein